LKEALVALLAVLQLKKLQSLQLLKLLHLRMLKIYGVCVRCVKQERLAYQRLLWLLLLVVLLSLLLQLELDIVLLVHGHAQTRLLRGGRAHVAIVDEPTARSVATVTVFQEVFADLGLVLLVAGDRAQFCGAVCKATPDAIATEASLGERATHFRLVKGGAVSVGALRSSGCGPILASRAQLIERCSRFGLYLEHSFKLGRHGARKSLDRKP
jgi:hypothetical protein